METAIAEADTVAAAAAAAVAAASGQSHIHFPAAICAEIQNVLAAMRLNSRWNSGGIGSGGGSGSGGDDAYETHVAAFTSLRRNVFSWHRWEEIDPIWVAEPFLNVIRSEETSGPITGIALSAVLKFIDYGLLECNDAAASSAVHAVADAVCNCRFEFSEMAADEVVIAKILLVLLAAVRCPAGRFLNASTVKNILEATFRIGHNGRESELLQRSARQTLLEITRAIFCRVSKAARERVQATDADNVSIDNFSEEQAAMQVLEFLKLLLNENLDDLVILGLHLTNAALECIGGVGLKVAVHIQSSVCNDIVPLLLLASGLSNLSILSLLCSILLTLYVSLANAPSLVAIVETLTREIVLKIVEGKSTASDNDSVRHGPVSAEQREIALEALVDLCRQPGFAPRMFSRLDCDIGSSNLLQDIVQILSRQSFPDGSSGTTRTQLLALEGLLALTHDTAEAAASAQKRPEEMQSHPNQESVQESLTLGNEDGQSPWLVVEGDEFNALSLSEKIQTLRWRRRIKAELTKAAEHFNVDAKKGIQFLETEKLVPSPATAYAVALFLRRTPGLSLTAVGEYLGDHKQFNVDVLTEFAKTFISDFRRLGIEVALRMFLMHFRLPGEAQKIARVLEAFANTYHQAVMETERSLASADTSYILAYSVIMLNTDLWSKKVKKKMSIEDFIRNNRGINDGNDLPKHLLEAIYCSIAANEIKLRGDIKQPSLSPFTKTPEHIPGEATDLLAEDVFQLLCNPLTTSSKVIFTHSKNLSVLRDILDGLICLTKVATTWRLQEIVDIVVANLSEVVLSIRPAVARGGVGNGSRRYITKLDAYKAEIALATMVTIVKQHGDFLRDGWGSIIDSFLQLYEWNFLSESIFDNVNVSEIKQGSQTAPAQQTNSGLATQFRNFVGGSGEYIDLLGSKGSEPIDPSSLSFDSACSVEEIFSDSKFLQVEALQKMAEALRVAGVSSIQKSPLSSTNCLKLLMAVTLRNRDRIKLVWPSVIQLVDGLVKSNCEEKERILIELLTELLQLCQRLLHYREDLSDQLLQSLQTILDNYAGDSSTPRVSNKIAAKVSDLVNVNVAYVNSAEGWRTLSALLTLSANATDKVALESSFEAIKFVSKDGQYVNLDNFMACTDAIKAFAARKHSVEVEEDADFYSNIELQAVQLLAHLGSQLHDWLVETSRQTVLPKASSGFSLFGSVSPASLPDELKAKEKARKEKNDKLTALWGEYLDSVRYVCCHAQSQTRLSAIHELQELMSSQNPSLKCNITQVRDTPIVLASFEKALFPLIDELLSKVVDSKEKTGTDIESSLKQAFKALSKVFLKFLNDSGNSENLQSLWLEIIEKLDICFQKLSGREEFVEMIPESFKNMANFMHSKGFLKRETTSDSSSLWEQTWERAPNLSLQLKSEIFENP